MHGKHWLYIDAPFEHDASFFYFALELFDDELVDIPVAI